MIRRLIKGTGSMSLWWGLVVVLLGVGLLMTMAVGALAETNGSDSRSESFLDDLRKRKAQLDKRAEKLDRREARLDKLKAELEQRREDLVTNDTGVEPSSEESSTSEEQDQANSTAEAGSEPPGDPPDTPASANLQAASALPSSSGEPGSAPEASGPNSGASVPECTEVPIDPARKERVQELSKKIKAMKPTAAARLIGVLDTGLAVDVYRALDARSSGKILDKMPAEVAASLSERMVDTCGGQP